MDVSGALAFAVPRTSPRGLARARAASGGVGRCPARPRAEASPCARAATDGVARRLPPGARPRHDTPAAHRDAAGAALTRTRAEGLQRDAAVAQAGAERATQTAGILSADDVRRIKLAGQPAAPGAAGTAFWSASRGQLLLSAANLPSPGAGRKYQLWVIPPGSKTPVSAGMLDLSPDGRILALASTTSVAQVGQVAISDEPAGGVQSPTGPIVLAGSL